MQNYKAIAKQLQQELNSLNLSGITACIDQLEKILQKNIAIDEIKLENNETLEFVDINEKIKDIIFSAYLEYHVKTGAGNPEHNVKVYLDDKRSTIDGYIRAFWPSQVEEYIKMLNVSEISLDHDLGNDDIGTGYDVVCFIEENVYFNKDFNVPVLKTHTDNSSARDKMQRGIKQILQMKNN